MFECFYRLRDLLRLRRAVIMADEAHALNGQRFYVMPTDDGKLIVMDKQNFRILKRKHYAAQTATTMDMTRECFYCTPHRDGKGELPPDVIALKKRQYLAWARAYRKNKRSGRTVMPPHHHGGRPADGPQQFGQPRQQPAAE